MPSDEKIFFLLTITVVKSLHELLLCIFVKCTFGHTFLTRLFGNRHYGADLCWNGFGSFQ